MLKIESRIINLVGHHLYIHCKFVKMEFDNNDSWIEFAKLSTKRRRALYLFVIYIYLSALINTSNHRIVVINYKQECIPTLHIGLLQRYLIL